MGDTEGLSECNLAGNYFVYGPSSSSNSHITGTTPSYHVFCKDNWIDDNTDGLLDGRLMTEYKTATIQRTPYSYPGVNHMLSAQDAIEHVIENAGASIARDAVDEFLINELLSYGETGRIIETEDDNGIENNVGTVPGGSSPTDTDQDGIPDYWEIKYGLNPDNTEDFNGTELSADGYTNIEMYVNEVAGDSIVFADNVSVTREKAPFPEKTEHIQKYKAQIVELYDLQGHFVYKGSKIPAFLPSGLSVVIDKTQSGYLLNLNRTINLR
jgi:hypothetical protein